MNAFPPSPPHHILPLRAIVRAARQAPQAPPRGVVCVPPEAALARRLARMSLAPAPEVVVCPQTPSVIESWALAVLGALAALVGRPRRPRD